MKPLTPAERWAEHCGDLSYLTGASAVSRLGAGPPLRASGRPTGRAAADVTFSAPPDVAECTNERSTSGFEPGCSSLTREQIAESNRIQLMVANHRFKIAERERLDDLARGTLLT